MMMGETRLSLSLLFRLGMRSAPPHARPTNVTVAFISNLLTNQIWPHKNAPRGFTRVLGSRWNRGGEEVKIFVRGTERRGGPGPGVPPLSGIIGAQIRKLHQVPNSGIPPCLNTHTDQSQIVRIFCAHVPLTKLSLGKYFRYQKIPDSAQEVLSDPGNVVNVFQALPRCRWSLVKQKQTKNKQTNWDDLDFSTT